MLDPLDACIEAVRARRAAGEPSVWAHYCGMPFCDRLQERPADGRCPGCGEKVKGARGYWGNYPWEPMGAPYHWFPLDVVRGAA